MTILSKNEHHCGCLKARGGLGAFPQASSCFQIILQPTSEGNYQMRQKSSVESLCTKYPESVTDKGFWQAKKMASPKLSPAFDAAVNPTVRENLQKIINLYVYFPVFLSLEKFRVRFCRRYSRLYNAPGTLIPD